MVTVMTEALANTHDIIVGGFSGQSISMANLSLANRATGRRPFDTMRNNKGKFDVPIWVTCLSGSMEQLGADITITHAVISIAVVLENCNYAHGGGFSWEADEESYKIVDFNDAPNIIFYNGTTLLNDKDAENIYLHFLDKKMEDSAYRKIRSNLLINSKNAELFNVFNELLNCDSLYAKDGKNQP